MPARNQFNSDVEFSVALRDYFAATAMQGWLASFGPEDAVKVGGVAELAYDIADAMLAAREAQS